MGVQEPSLSVEPEKPAIDGNAANEAKGDIGVPEKKPKDTAFRRFMSGPYFDMIPAQYERTAHTRDRGLQPQKADGKNSEQLAGEDYLGRLKNIVTSSVDADGQYGLRPDELVPLPFDVPQWHAYLVDILSGVYLVAQATIVMFIAIYVENQERAWKSGSGYTHSWQPLVKALIIVYPLITLIILVSFTVEYCIRKFMYFRLLSMRILVDWANVLPHKGIFFYYFLATWALMNAWAVYGVAKYYNKDGNKGVDATSFGTFVVVNLQTVQLLLYYFKLLSTESRLVSLNQIFERAPVEAQRLLEYTYVIEEEELIDECYAFALHSQRALLRRILNILTLGCAAKDWNESARQMRVDIERLKKLAPNYDQVEQNVRDLLDDMGKQQPSPGGARNANDAKSNPDQVELRVSGPGSGAPDTAPPALGPDGRPLPRELPSEYLSLCGLRPLRWAYRNVYASLHSLHTSVLVGYGSWPFRPDVPYFRMLTLIQFVGIFAVGAIVVLGWLYSARDSSCAKSTKTCNTCLSVFNRYYTSSEPLCLSMETAVANIVASAAGTWDDDGVVERRYCDFMCTGNFTASTGSCPVGS